MSTDNGSGKTGEKGDGASLNALKVPTASSKGQWTYQKAQRAAELAETAL